MATALKGESLVTVSLKVGRLLAVHDQKHSRSVWPDMPKTHQVWSSLVREDRSALVLVQTKQRCRSVWIGAAGSSNLVFRHSLLNHGQGELPYSKSLLERGDVSLKSASHGSDVVVVVLVKRTRENAEDSHGWRGPVVVEALIMRSLASSPGVRRSP